MRKRERLNFNKVINDRNGFTLAELLLVVGIVVILSGISILAASYYYKVIKLNEMDNTAKQIFIAAQNHLTSAQSTGELDRYVKSHGDDIHDSSALNADQIELGNKMTYKPSDVDDTNIVKWPTKPQENKFYYIVYNPGNNISDSVLQYALPKGAIDDYINTEGKYIIEYNADTASVYGVFYTEAKNNLDLNTISNELNQASPNSGRGGSSDAKKIRRNHTVDGKNQIVGYYGGAMAKQWKIKDSLISLNVQNGNDLHDENWRITSIDKQDYEKERLTAIIRVPNDINAQKIVLHVKGKTSGNDALVICDAKDKDGSIVYDIECGKPGTSTKTFGSVYNNTNITEQYREYQVVLDDIVDESYLNKANIKNCHFGYLFPTFLPGEDIDLTAYVYDGTFIGQSNSIRENSLFGISLDKDKAVNDGTGEKTGTISSFRHLENIDNGISGIQRSNNMYPYKDKYTWKKGTLDEFTVNNSVATEEAGFIFNAYKQTCDLDWNTYFNPSDKPKKTIIGINKKNMTETVTSVDYYDAGSPNNNLIYPGTFYSINKCDLLEYSGKKERNEDGDYANEYAIKNVKVLNNKAIGSSANINNGGIFGFINYNTTTSGEVYKMRSKPCEIHDLVLYAPEIRAPKNTAVLTAEVPSFGPNKLIFNNVLVEKGSIKSGFYNFGAENTLVNSSDAKSNAGGLAGYVGGPISVSKCGSSAIVEMSGKSIENGSATDIGGLVGEINGKGSFDHSYTGGTTTTKGYYENENGKNYSPNIKGTYTAGGILGRSTGVGKVEMNYCYSTCSVSSKLKQVDNSNKTYAGGLLGWKQTDSVSFNHCYATGEITGETDPNGTYKGTIIGTGNASFSNCYYLNYSSKYNQNLVAKGNSSSDPSGVDSIVYHKMKSKAGAQDKGTYENNRNGSFPFRAVNDTGQKSGSYYDYVHYGDWPVDIPFSNLDGLMFAYKETSKKLTDGKSHVGWYVASKDNAQGKYKIIYDNLMQDKDSRLDTTWSYGFLCHDSLGSYFNQGNTATTITIGNQKYSKTSDYVNIDGEKCYYWKFSEVSGTSGDIITTPKQKDNNGDNVPNVPQFKFNQKFAACISTVTASNSGDIGTIHNEYQIRSEAQLNNINRSNTYLKNYFHQTLNIDLSGSDFVAIGKKSTTTTETFNGEYNGLIEGSDGESYSISNFKQKVTASDDSGLFGGIGKTGVVKNLNLVGASFSSNGIKPDAGASPDINITGFRENNQSVDIGGFAAVNGGTVVDCSAKLIISTGDDTTSLNLPNTLINIGGMFGSNINASNSDPGVVKGCSFRGELLFNNLKNNGDQSRIRAGAFAGRNNKDVSNCKVGTNVDPSASATVSTEEIVPLEVTVFSTKEMNNTRNDKIGGFIGEHNTTLSNNISNVALKYNGGNTDNPTQYQRYAMIGGFIGTRGDSKAITKCYGFGTLDVNGKTGYIAVPLHYHATNSAIGTFGGNLGNYEDESIRKAFVEGTYMGQILGSSSMPYSTPVTNEILKITSP